MRLQIIGLFFIMLSCLACGKEAKNDCPNNLESGSIIGIDFTLCPCCGGYWIEVGNDTLRAFVLPDNIEIADTSFSNGIDIPICLSYEKSTDCNVFEELIVIQEMYLQE